MAIIYFFFIIDIPAVGFSRFTPRYVAHKKILMNALSFQYSHGHGKQYEEMLIDEVNHVSSQFQSKMGKPFDPDAILYTAVGHIIWQVRLYIVSELQLNLLSSSS